AKHLDAIVPSVSNIDAPGRIDRDPVRIVELAIAITKTAPLGEERAGAGELLDAVVVAIRDVHVARGVGGDAPRKIELSFSGAGRSPLGEEGAAAGELLDA